MRVVILHKFGDWIDMESKEERREKDDSRISFLGNWKDLYGIKDGTRGLREW